MFASPATALQVRILAETRRDRIFWGGFFLGGFKNLGNWLQFPSQACVSGPLFLGNFPDFWPVSASLSLSLSHSFSATSKSRDWEVCKREGFGERNLARDLGVEKGHFPDQPSKENGPPTPPTSALKSVPGRAEARKSYRISNSSELPKGYRFVILGDSFRKATDSVTDF